MTPRGSYGMANPNSLFDAKQVREIRLLHLCDGIAASQIARDLGVNVSCISRIVNWKAWAHQDEDLRAIPKPAHKGGGDYHRPKGDVVPVTRLTCRKCLHLNSNTGGIECIDAIEAALTPEEFAGFCKGNAIKYLWRMNHKGGKESLAKARWYVNLLFNKP